MRTVAAGLVLLLLAACDAKPAAVSGTGEVTAIAAAERKTVSDTDAALRDAARASDTGTKGADDRSPR